MYKILPVLLLSLLSTTNLHALECKFVAKQIESVIRYSDTSRVVATLDDVNIKLEKLIKMCGANAHKVSHAPIPKVTIFDARSNKSKCNKGIVSKQAENAQRAVGVQVGRVRDAAKTASDNTDILAKILISCINNKK